MILSLLCIIAFHFQSRVGFSPGAPANLYNTSRCGARETTPRNTGTPTTGTTRFSNHTNVCTNATPSPNPVRIKLADSLNQSPIPNNLSQPIKLQINQK